MPFVDETLVVKPFFQTQDVDIAHRSRTLARAYQMIIFFFLRKADSTVEYATRGMGLLGEHMLIVT